MSNLSNSINYLQNIIDTEYKRKDVLKRKYGIVRQVFSYSKIEVILADEDMTEIQNELIKKRSKIDNGEIDEKDLPFENYRRLSLMNKTGEYLEIGDAVWVYYWKTLSDGYIALKIGLSKIRRDLNIDKLAILSTEQAILYNSLYKDQYDSLRKINIDKRKEIDILSGSPNEAVNTIFLNGYPALIFEEYGRSTYTLQTLLKNHVNPKLLSKEIRLYCNHEGKTSDELEIDSKKESLFTINFLRKTQKGVASQSVYPNYGVAINANYGGFEECNYLYATSSAINGLNIPLKDILDYGMIIFFQNNLHKSTEQFPYGYISGRIAMINKVWDSSAVSWGDKLNIGFANQEEYEYAKCVLLYSICEPKSLKEIE